MKRHDLDELPLFASDHDLGVALLGSTRAREWPAMAPLYERRGLPKIDPDMGGRYVPAVRAFFDREYSINSPAGPMRPDGIERPETWNRPKRRA